MFDLRVDPDELNDLAALDPVCSLRTDMLEVLADAMMHANDLIRTEPVSR